MKDFRKQLLEAFGDHFGDSDEGLDDFHGDENPDEDYDLDDLETEFKHQGVGTGEVDTTRFEGEGRLQGLIDQLGGVEFTDVDQVWDISEALAGALGMSAAPEVEFTSEPELGLDNGGSYSPGPNKIFLYDKTAASFVHEFAHAFLNDTHGITGNHDWDFVRAMTKAAEAFYQVTGYGQDEPDVEPDIAPSVEEPPEAEYWAGN